MTRFQQTYKLDTLTNWRVNLKKKQYQQDKIVNNTNNHCSSFSSLAKFEYGIYMYKLQIQTHISKPYGKEGNCLLISYFCKNRE